MSSSHIYKNSLFNEIINDAVLFFEKTPLCSLPPSEPFAGRGVYALYYSGDYLPYNKLSQMTQVSYCLPIYVGKAVPRGWRQSRIDSSDTEGNELYLRLKEHFRSIDAADNLNPTDFKTRYMVLAGECSDMIGTVEATLIKRYQPLWNSVVDGFGNHDPGNGRYNQARSDWDVVHPGRPWASRCQGTPNSESQIKEQIEYYIINLEDCNEHD